jgi:lipopolysaccharide export system protein LptC
VIPRPPQIAGIPGAAHAPRPRATALPGRLARRRILITLTKFLLPIGAAALLAMVALWPDLEGKHDATRFSFSNVSGEVEGGRLKNARYRGIDEKGRPYTLTTDIARQIDPERVELTRPQGDVTQEGGAWLNLKAEHGIYMQKANTLDLWQDVVLYRDDGTTLTTASASLDIKNGTATGKEPVHAEGPFGTLDAQAFTVTGKGTAIQFTGPARVLLSGASR